MNSPGPRPGRDHILITGVSKSGTTGVYQSVKQALRAAAIRARTLFEPPRTEHIDNLLRLAPDVPVMTKMTMDGLRRVSLDPATFDRRVMTVRDPRDVIVSTLLFRPLINRVVRTLDRRALDAFVAALRRKEADPSAVSVRELFELETELGMGVGPSKFMRWPLERQRELLEQAPFHIVRYESFVRGDLDDLSDYLGFPVENVSAQSSSTFGHIARSQEAGAFTQWFREDDLTYFNGLFDEYLDTFGYPKDVELAAEPAIDPSASSEYVESRFDQRWSDLHTKSHSGDGRSWTPRDCSSPAQFERLTERGDDGDLTACLQAAQVAMSGHIAGLDDHDALTWARAAATLGSVPGTRLTIELLDRLDADDPGLHRERRKWAAELHSRSDDAVHSRIQELETELATVSSSLRYRAGTQVVDAGRHPWRDGPRAVRELAAMLRRARRS